MHWWIVIVLTTATLLTLYLGWRLINPTGMARKWKFACWLVLGGLLFGQRFTWVIWRNERNDWLLGSIDWVGFTFLGVVSILVMLMFVRDFPILVKRVMGFLETIFIRRSKRPYFIEPNRDRRRFLLNATNAGLIAVTLPASGFAIYEARRVPDVVHNELLIPDLPEGLDGFTIAQITDTHIGPTIRGEWLRDVVAETNALNADLIVHTGDMVDGSVASLRSEVKHFGDLKAPYGVWMCTGNHEYYSGVEEWLSEASRLGMTPLNNEHTLLDTGKGKVLLAGVTDIRGDRVLPDHVSSPAKAKEGAPEHDVSILLAHQPRSIFDASKAGFDVQLSGHTHGGQYFPYTLFINLFQPYVRGLHLHENTMLYVSRGTGYWGPPLRLGSPPEITLHTLRRA